MKPLAPLLAILLALPFAQAAQVAGTQVSFQSPALSSVDSGPCGGFRT